MTAVQKSEQTRRALAPRLRFPEFREAWTSSHVSELYSFKGNNSLSRDKLNYISGSLKNIHYGDIHTKFSLHFHADTELVPYINDGESHSTIRPGNYCMVGDMVFADASEDIEDIGKAIEIIDAGCVALVSGLHTILARPHEGYFASGFCAYLFLSEGVKKQIQREAQGAKVLGLSASRLGKVQLDYPSRPAEQQKIASCLSSLDDLIAAESWRLDALKTHKKGLMQQLFPREGETKPRLRFPEFRDAGTWKELTVAEVCEINPARTNKQDHELVSFIPMTAVSEDGRIKNPEIRTYAAVKKGYTAFAENDIIIAKITPCFENGKAALVKCLKHGVGFGSTEFHVFRSGKSCLPEFLFFQLYRDNVRSAGARSMIGNAGQRRVPASFFEIFPFYLPTIEEQQALVSFLLSLDDLITAQTQKLDALKTHKKGLMQQLFPAPDAVTE